MGVLDFGSGILLLGIGGIVLVFICKMFFVILEKEFKIFWKLIKIALGIIVAGGCLMFLGRLL